MAAYEFWVNPSTGNNANAGTEGAPFQTLRYACYNSLIGSWGPTTSVTVNVVPSVNLIANDRISLYDLHLGGSILVRSSTGVNFTAINNYDCLIETTAGGTNGVAATLRIENCTCTRNKVVFWSGTERANRDLDITFAGSCIFTHARVNSENCIWIRNSPTGVGSVNIESGCQLTGWDVFFNLQAGAVSTVDIDGAIISSDNTTATTGGINYLSGVDVTITNSTINISNGAVDNQFIITSTDQITIQDNTVTMLTTGNSCVWVRTLASGSATIDLDFSRNTITGTTGNSGNSVIIGRDLVTGSTRSANDAAGANLLSCLVESNDVVQLNLDAGAIALMVDTDAAIVQDNYFRVGTLGDTANVHHVYLWGDGIVFRSNYLQAQVLAFGPNQVIRDNVIVANRGILLGGTQTGSTVSGGGNSYTITDNVLVAFDLDCYSDYTGAYPTYLGELLATIDRNKYVALSGADGIATLGPPTALVATTITQLQNIWQYTSLSVGASNVWGEASNSTNDGASQLITGGRFDTIAALCVQSATLTRSQLQFIKNVLSDDGFNQIVLLIG